MFIRIKGEKERNSPVALALKQVVELLTDCDVVDNFVDKDTEVDVAIVDSLSEALRLQKETEEMIIVILCLKNDEFESAKAFAERSNGRVRPMSVLSVVAGLVTLIGEIIMNKKGEK